MKKVLTLTLLMLLKCAVFSDLAFGARNSDLDEKRVAAFIQNLHDNILSPTGKICLYGYDGVVTFLVENMDNKVVELNNTKNDKLISGCNLAYIASNKEKYMASFINDFNERGVATIGYLDSFIEKNGAFFLQEGRRGSIELVLNREILKKLTIKLNPIIFSVISN